MNSLIHLVSNCWDFVAPLEANRRLTDGPIRTFWRSAHIEYLVGESIQKQFENNDIVSSEKFDMVIFLLNRKL